MGMRIWFSMGIGYVGMIQYGYEGIIQYEY